MGRLSRNSPAGRRQASRAAWTATKPTNTVAPAITGTAQQGQTLTVSNGTWAGNTPTYSRQWLRDGVAISGATGATYVLQAADVGHVITCRVTATNAVDTASAVSNATASVASAEYWPQPAFDASTGLTQVGDPVNVTGGEAVKANNGDPGALQAAVSIPSGTSLAISINVTSNPGGAGNKVRVDFLNAAQDTVVGMADFTGTGVQNGNVTLTGAAAYARLYFPDGLAASVTSLSITPA